MAAGEAHFLEVYTPGERQEIARRVALFKELTDEEFFRAVPIMLEEIRS